MAAASELLPIRTISALTGVNAITLRAWERRYGLITPGRTSKGHRLYTHEHVEEIRRVIALVERGVPISRVREIIEAQRPTDAQARGPWKEYLQRLMAAVARFDEPELDRIYDEALSVHAIDNLTRKLVLPLLAHLGERWKDVDGAIAEEHFFATYLRSKLGARLQHRMRYAEGPRLVAACTAGEHHEIGLLLFALEASEAGLKPILLGADTPLADIAIAQRRSRAGAIVLSSSVGPAPGLLESALPRLVAETTVPVFVGGATSIRFRHAIASAGAVPLGADLEDGIRLLKRTLATKGAGK
jgi:MerR family transcriptional regulator, light-induced transcriptional regulator